ncbi:hypothetical protein M431DRAFT_514432 [Trichoderma harzianum CBS 226.95]|uniref:RNase H type-1 domain-containing protein n=1 Tax=Trichoderma harzianum CBS 226.95 TaxID=983964 RepID=A0A2T3ZR95_TRIHA|nr:hypothetical protein M431DRAFT_514432 [Trichoderma harzianum CBS 226.95]PTB47323.1 hypothetical protein M431DRAFT_514432 [Trichoderma harzianum CBS 226.95]
MKIPLSMLEVYDAEARGAAQAMKLALRIIRDSPSVREAYFFLDHSAVVDGLLGTPPESSQEEYIAFQKGAKAAYPIRITVAWVPGHKDVPGNEAEGWNQTDGTQNTPQHHNTYQQMGQIDRKEPLGEALVQLHARGLQEMAFKDTQRARTNSASTEASYITCTRKGPAMGTSKATTTGSTTKRKSNASAEKQETRTPSKVQTHGPPPPRNASRHYFLLRRDGHKRFQKFVEEADPYGPPTTTQD